MSGAMEALDMNTWLTGIFWTGAKDVGFRWATLAVNRAVLAQL